MVEIMVKNAHVRPVDRLREQVRAAVPAPFGWNGFGPTTLNLLVVALVMFAGVWSVHQTEYLLEYGSRFSAVMATTPHRFYMAPAGLALLLTITAALAALLSALHYARAELLHHRNMLSPRLARRLTGPDFHLPVRALLRTAVVLAVAQIALYTLQENLEGLALTGRWLGLAVLLAPHLTVVPLHLLVALGSAVLLHLASARLRQTRSAVRLARILAALIPNGAGSPPRWTLSTYLPDSCPLSGAIGLRAPPLAA